MMRATESALKVNRSSVVDQAAAALRTAIRNGELRDPLPGGYQLAGILGVSRPSVRAALRRLAAEGVLVIKQGHRTRLAQERTSPIAAVPPAVCVVSPASLASPFIPEHPILMEMHAQFASRGVRWEAVFEPRLAGKHPQARLQQLVEVRPHVGWILFNAPEPIQRWFATARVPTLVLGSCAAGLNLPSVDFDYGAVGWHAAGAIVGHGHRNVGLILPNTLLPGDAASRDAFLRYLAQTATGVSVTEFRAPEDPAQFRTRLARLLFGPHRPTALLVMKQTLALTTITEVLGSGLRIPRDVSIVLRDTHPLIDSALSEYTRYSSSSTALATRAVNIAESLLSGRRVPAKPSLITPTFVPGSTLAARGRTR